MDSVKIQEFISDIQSGGGKLPELMERFSDDMKGTIAKQYWNEDTFRYGMEYGALLILNHLLEVAEP